MQNTSKSGDIAIILYPLQKEITQKVTTLGDCLILNSKDFSVNEAALTGETYPADKFSGVLSADVRLIDRTSILYLGTNVISGTATTVVVVRQS